MPLHLRIDWVWASFGIFGTNKRFSGIFNLSLSVAVSGVGPISQNCIQDLSNLWRGLWAFFVLPVRAGYRRRSARIHYDSSGAKRSVKLKHRLHGHIHCCCIEGLEHDLCHALTMCFRAQWRLCEKRKVLGTQGGRNGCSPAHRYTRWSKWLCLCHSGTSETQDNWFIWLI